MYCGVDIKEQLIQSWGFDEDPFQYINADQEERLDHYFVDPPYFRSLWGNPQKPESHVVLAPRGGGKSAQRRMIESKSEKEGVFVITYDSYFTTSMIKNLDGADLNFHVQNINRLMLLSVFSHLAMQDFSPDMLLEGHERQFLTKMVDQYLGDVDIPTIRGIVSQSITMPAKFKQWWNENLPFVGVFGAFLKSQFGLDIGVAKSFETSKLTDDPIVHFNILLSLVKRLGFVTCYILIDKVDETELTGNDAEKAYHLIKALIKDLRFVNSNEFGMKFFLWDALEPYYSVDARRDRVQEFRLEWNLVELKTMISRRLSAYSSGRISKLSQIINVDYYDVDQLVIAFSNNSPRNVIRILQDIVDEHIRRGKVGKIDVESLDSGIKKFCRETARSICGNNEIKDLKRINRVGFTTSFLSSDLFKSANAARRKIQLWDKAGIIKQVCDLPNKTGRPSPYYLITNSIFVPIILESESCLDLVRDMAIPCTGCGRTHFIHIEHFENNISPLCPNCDSRLL